MSRLEATCLWAYAWQLTECLRRFPIRHISEAVQPLPSTFRLGQEGLHRPSDEFGSALRLIISFMHSITSKIGTSLRYQQSAVPTFSAKTCCQNVLILKMQPPCTFCQYCQDALHGPVLKTRQRQVDTHDSDRNLLLPQGMPNTAALQQQIQQPYEMMCIH